MSVEREKTDLSRSKPFENNVELEEEGQSNNGHVDTCVPEDRAAVREESDDESREEKPNEFVIEGAVDFVYEKENDRHVKEGELRSMSLEDSCEDCVESSEGISMFSTNGVYELISKKLGYTGTEEPTLYVDGDDVDTQGSSPSLNNELVTPQDDLGATETREPCVQIVSFRGVNGNEDVEIQGSPPVNNESDPPEDRSGVTETDEPSLPQIGAFRVGGNDLETQDSPFANNEELEEYATCAATIEAYRVEEEQPLQIVQAKRFRQRRALIAIATFGVLILVIGLTLFLTRGNERPVVAPSSSQESDPRGTLQARLVINHLEDEQTLVEAQRFHNAENAETISTGFFFTYACKVLPCLEGGDEACKVSQVLEDVYEPGCCIGENCTEEEKCFDGCPPYACRNTIAYCTNPSCIECDKADDGTDLYIAIFVQLDINCLDTGYATTDSGEVYKWAIFCGPVSSAGQEELNLGIGEYACAAARQGESVMVFASFLLPCQYIQLAECGCAPDDVFDFGLGHPEKPCRTREDCFILCGDAGENNAKELCYSFGGIEWWEGTNAFNQTKFQSHYEGFFNKTTIEIFDESPPS